MNSPGVAVAKPIGVLDLKYGPLDFGSRADPPPTLPRRAPGPKSAIVRTTCGALGGPFFDHFFASILSSILDSFWVRFGLVLGSFWHPLGAHIGSSWVKNAS